jgi:ribonuclease T2
MNKRASRPTPLQIIMLVVILAAVTVYRMSGSSAGPDSSSPQPTAAAPQATSTTPTRETPVPQEQTSPNRPTATHAVNSNPSTAMKAFDYFVLSLSWAPDYCTSNGSQDVQECALGKKLGFVLHGLWPQNKQGYPSNCSKEKMSEAVKTQFPRLYPNDALYDHEWEKHGTCTGLPPQQYLSLTQQLKESVIIPADFKSPSKAFRITADEMKQDFTASNPDLSPVSLAVNCSGSGRFLSEMYVCFSREGAPTPCSSEVLKNAAHSCQNSDFLVRNTR